MTTSHSDILNQGVQLIYHQADADRFPEGIALLEEAADKGEGEACFCLALCYIWGDGSVAPNRQKAYQLLKSGIENGSDLCVLIANRIETFPKHWSAAGAHTPEDAFALVKPDALTGDEVAQYALGLFYSMPDHQRPDPKSGKGLPPEENGAEMLKWFQTAADQGCIPAFCRAYFALRDGRGSLNQNLPAALKLAEEAKSVLEIPDDLYTNIAYCYSTLNQYSKQIHWLEMGIEHGAIKCFNDLGIVYYNGDGVLKDLEKAFALFQKGESYGDPNATFHLGLCYCYGWGIEADDVEAFLCFESAAEMGHSDAQRFLAWYYYEGLGTSADYEKCFQWATLSAEQGNESAKFFLGKCLLYGKGVSQDFEAARRYLEENAQRAENSDAYRRLGRIYEDGLGVLADLDQAVDYYQKALDRGCAKAEEDLARFKKGFLGKWKRR